MLIVAALLGYYPAVSLPTTGHSNEVLAAEQISSVSADALPFEFSLPHPGYLSTKFSYYHPGIDIATGLGMPVHPIAPGQITRVDFGFFGLGHEVAISHPGGFESTYGHLGRMFTKIGDNVSQASIIGEVGLTGHTSGPHTHLEVRKDGNLVDPQKVLPTIPSLPTPADFIPTSTASESNLRKTLKPDFN